MAEINPNLPSGAVPPKPAEAAKVQPKKETVRINLPPKPAAGPTIKIPGPAAPVAVTAAPVTPPTSSAAPVATTTTAAATVSTGSAPATSAPAQRAAAPAAARPAPRPAMVSGVSGLDKILAIVSAVVGLAVLVRILMLA